MSAISVEIGGARVVLEPVAELRDAVGRVDASWAGDDLLAATARALIAAGDGRATRVLALTEEAS